MQISFTDNEMKWIIKEQGEWRLKTGAPKNIKESATEKINQIKRYKQQTFRRRGI
jgi:hypothetical protein